MTFFKALKGRYPGEPEGYLRLEQIWGNSFILHINRLRVVGTLADLVGLGGLLLWRGRGSPIGLHFQPIEKLLILGKINSFFVFL